MSVTSSPNCNLILLKQFLLVHSVLKMKYHHFYAIVLKF